MGRPLKIKHSNTVDAGFNNPLGGKFYGVVGGNTDTSDYTYPVVKVRVKISGETEADGYIVRQKGSKKYLVSDGTNTGVCVLADKADGALADGEMTVTVILSNSSEVRLSRFTNKWGLDFSDPAALYLLNFFDISDNTIVKSGADADTWVAPQNTGAVQGTVDLVQVDNPSLWG